MVLEVFSTDDFLVVVSMEAFFVIDSIEELFSRGGAGNSRSRNFIPNISPAQLLSDLFLGFFGLLLNGLSGPTTNLNCFLPLCGGLGGFEDIFSLSWKFIFDLSNKYI